MARSNRVQGQETILFEYDASGLSDPAKFSLEPALALTRGAFAPPAGLATFGSIGDSAPDSWGRRLMQRAERLLDLLESAADYFALTLAQARAIIKEVASVTATWRETARAVGARALEIDRMASAFEHDDLSKHWRYKIRLSRPMATSPIRRRP